MCFYLDNIHVYFYTEDMKNCFIYEALFNMQYVMLSNVKLDVPNSIKWLKEKDSFDFIQIYKLLLNYKHD